MPRLCGRGIAGKDRPIRAEHDAAVLHSLVNSILADRCVKLLESLGSRHGRLGVGDCGLLPEHLGLDLRPEGG